MKRIITILLLLTCAFAKAQVNLVMNSGLETFTACPTYGDNIKFANHWMSLDSSWNPPDWAHDLNGVPEYCNICSSGPFGVPSTGVYYSHYPHSGNGMAQVQMFFNDADTTVEYKRDYLQSHLAGTLTAGQSYCVSFFVSLEHGSLWAINNIGAYLDNGTIDTTHKPDLIQTQYIPQILETSIIYDTLNWVKVQGSFIANGTERLITIGNFTDKRHMLYAPAPGKDTTGAYLGDSYSWYLVDDVSVMRSDAVANAGPDRIITSSHDTVLVGDTTDSYLPTYWYAGGVLVDSNKGGFMIHVDTNTTFVVSLDVCGHVTYDTMVIAVHAEQVNSTIRQFDNVAISPNPAMNEIIVQHASSAVLVLYDVMGREVFRAFVTSDKQVVDIEKIPRGIYVAQVMDLLTGEKRVMRILKE